ncbi:hypothetical protein HDF14_005427 [Edaphobacter lichenicola]|jgi:hypothetical protein|uniref:Uncharacterized protein n=1 Tax=Tunturiibacter gelidiferens TaxID=3069689 RepID=A0A9X0U6S3_9BACT|nr:hypothetical protein [Edaphobacter lichenicola]
MGINVLVATRGVGKHSLEIRCDHPAFPSEACAIRPIWPAFTAGFRTYRLPIHSSFPVHNQTSANMEFSFLITAAGQFRALTGFPFSLLLKADTGNNLSIDQINIPNNVRHRH